MGGQPIVTKEMRKEFGLYIKALCDIAKDRGEPCVIVTPEIYGQNCQYVHPGVGLYGHTNAELTNAGVENIIACNGLPLVRCDGGRRGFVALMEFFVKFGAEEGN